MDLHHSYDLPNIMARHVQRIVRYRSAMRTLKGLNGLWTSLHNSLMTWAIRSRHDIIFPNPVSDEHPCRAARRDNRHHPNSSGQRRERH